jgi:hypothetical protein
VARGRYTPPAALGRGVRLAGPPSSSGLGFRPFKAATRVRIPLGARTTQYTRLWRSPESSSPCQGEDRGIEARQPRWNERRSETAGAFVPGQVAQLAEHAAENRGVGSSNLPLATSSRERSGLLASRQLDDPAAADVEEVARAVGSASRRSLGQTVPHLAVVVATTVVALDDHGIRAVALDAAVVAHGSRVVRRPRLPTTSRSHRTVRTTDQFVDSWLRSWVERESAAW